MISSSLWHERNKSNRGKTIHFMKTSAAEQHKQKDEKYRKYRKPIAKYLIFIYGWNSSSDLYLAYLFLHKQTNKSKTQSMEISWVQCNNPYNSYNFMDVQGVNILRHPQTWFIMRFIFWNKGRTRSTIC